MFLKNFKKVSSDKHTTTLKHKDGHELKVAHKGLSKKMRDSLEDLQHYADGGEVDGKSQAPVTINIGQPANQMPKPMAAPTPQPAPAPAPAPQAPTVQPLDATSPAPAVQPPQQVAQSEPQAPEEATPATAEERPVVQAKRQVAQAGVKPSNPDYEKDIYTQTLNNKDADYYNDLVSGNIKPKTYQDLFHNKDTVGKIGTLFGLLLSGAGSGLAHQPNAVLHMMDQQINNDFEAQKQNKTNALTMLQRYQQHQNDLSTRTLQHKQGQLMLAQTEKERQEAAGLTYKNKMFISALHAIESDTDKLPPGAQKQAAMGGVNILRHGVMEKVTQNNATAANMLSDAEARWQKKNQLLNLAMPEQAKYQAERHIPGVGDASIPQSGDDRKQILGINNFQNLLEEATKLNEKLGKRGAWTPTEKARAAQVHNDLVSSYNDVKGLNRFTGNEEALYDQIIPDLARVNLTGSAKKTLEALKASVQKKKDLEYTQRGLPTSGGSEQQSPEESVSKSGRPIVKVNGKWMYK